jgi:hypothetical protein
MNRNSSAQIVIRQAGTDYRSPAVTQISMNAQLLHLEPPRRVSDNERVCKPRMDLTMKEQRARQILQALVQGVDPLTGEELPSGTVLQQADVLRALLAGLAALEQTSARAQRRAQLPDNVGRPWSADEETKLIEAFESGEALLSIAARHGRTLRAIEARLERLGLLTVERRSTISSFVGSKRPSD